VYSVFVLLLLLYCFICILVLLLCYVSRSSLYCNIPSDLCTLFFMLLLLHNFIFILVLLLCCVSRSSLYFNIPSDLCTLCLSCYYFYIVLSLYLYCCYVVYLDHRFTVIYLQTCVLCVCLVNTLHCFIFILVLLLCCVSRSSLYRNMPSDLWTMCLSCYYFYIVLFVYLYCCYAMYPDHHFTVIYLQTCVLCVCVVITSIWFYLYTCIVVMLCI
jgi:hypothetical protein